MRSCSARTASASCIPDMKAIGYFRADDTAGASARQNKAFLEYCTAHGYDVAGTFVDDVAANGAAPGFRQMLAFLRERQRDVIVIVPSIAAVGAGIADAARRCYQIESLGARIAPLSGESDVTAGIVTAWSAQDAGSTVGDRVRAAMRKKAVKGEVLGRPPYGYKVGNRRRLELIPEEAVVVRYIYRLYLTEGMGIRLIARRLNEEGLKTRRGGNWSMVSIRDILRNRVYLGTYSRFGVKVPGSHPSLVSNDDFRVVQDRLAARRTSSSPRVTSRFLLSGIAYCGACGNKLIGVSRKQTWKRKSGERVQNSYRYYQCESRTNQSVCTYHTRRADDLERDVLQLLGEQVASPPDAPAPAPKARTERDRERLLTKMKAIDKRIERSIEAGARGRMTRDKMQRLVTAAAAERLALEDAADAAARRLAGGDTDRLASLARVVAGWETMRFTELHGALREAVERVTVSDAAVALSMRP